MDSGGIAPIQLGEVIDGIIHFQSAEIHLYRNFLIIGYAANIAHVAVVYLLGILRLHDLIAYPENPFAAVGLPFFRVGWVYEVTKAGVEGIRAGFGFFAVGRKQGHVI